MIISAIVLKLKRGPVSILKIIKRQNSINNVGGVKFLFSAYCLLMFYIGTILSENFFHNIKVIERTQYLCKYHKGA